MSRTSWSGGPPELQRGARARGQLENFDGRVVGVVDEEHSHTADVDNRLGAHIRMPAPQARVGVVEIGDAKRDVGVAAVRAGGPAGTSPRKSNSIITPPISPPTMRPSFAAPPVTASSPPPSSSTSKTTSMPSTAV